MPSIVDIDKVVSGLDGSDKELFDRLFSVQVNTGSLKVTDEMKDWVKDTFGSVKEVEEQKIIRVTNNFTHECSLFNELRAKRPMVASSGSAEEDIKSSEGGPFCNPGTGTPEDVFGRVEGDRGVTASNVAKYDGWHGLVVFDEHNPLKFNQTQVLDRIETVRKWFDKVREEDEDAKYPLVLWQCLWKAAASIVHGHMQMLLGSDSHYGGVEFLNKVRQDYIANYGTDYFQDLYKAHEAVGLGLEYEDVKVMAYLAPRKEKEVVLLSQEFSDDLAKALYKTLQTFRDDFGVESFTVGIMLPPLTEESGWEGFPVVVRIIDRGSLDKKTADVGTLELLGIASVVASDPFKVFEKLESRL